MSTPSDQFPPSSPPSPPPSGPLVGESSDDRNLAMLTHLSGFLLSIIVPLVMWLVHKDRPEKAYLVREAKEALNFQITVLIGYFICGILSIILIGVLLGWLLWVMNVVICIIAAVRVAANGTYRYPFALRLVN